MQGWKNGRVADSSIRFFFVFMTAMLDPSCHLLVNDLILVFCVSAFIVEFSVQFQHLRTKRIFFFDLLVFSRVAEKSWFFGFFPIYFFTHFLLLKRDLIYYSETRINYDKSGNGDATDGLICFFLVVIE
jgi:hypothetical protein